MNSQNHIHSGEYQMIHGFGQIVGQTGGNCPKHHFTNFVFVRGEGKNEVTKICEECLLEDKLKMSEDE